MRGTFVIVALVGTAISSASACEVGSALTRANFIKLTACVNKLETQLTAVTGQLNQMNNANGVVAYKALDPGVPRGLGSYPTFSGTMSLVDPAVNCPPGSWIAAIQGFKISGGADGIQGEPQALAELRYTCRSLK